MFTIKVPDYGCYSCIATGSLFQCWRSNQFHRSTFQFLSVFPLWSLMSVGAEALRCNAPSSFAIVTAVFDSSSVSDVIKTNHHIMMVDCCKYLWCCDCRIWFLHLVAWIQPMTVSSISHLPTCRANLGWQTRDLLAPGSLGPCFIMAGCGDHAPKDLPGKVEDKSSGRGLALKWDNIDAIRQRMRDGYNLLIHYDEKLKKATNQEVEKTTVNVKANYFVLAPVCQMMFAHGLVNIDGLEQEVKQLYSMYNVLANEKTVGKQAWAIRHLISVLKQSIKADKTDRTKPKRCPKDSLYDVMYYFVFGFFLGCPNANLVSLPAGNPSLRRTRRCRTFFWIWASLSGRTHHRSLLVKHLLTKSTDHAVVSYGSWCFFLNVEKCDRNLKLLQPLPSHITKPHYRQ